MGQRNRRVRAETDLELEAEIIEELDFGDPEYAGGMYPDGDPIRLEEVFSTGQVPDHFRDETWR